MSSTVKLNAKNLVDLNLIIDRYEAVKPDSGATVVSKSWKVFDGLQMNLEVLKSTTDTQKLYQEFKNYLGNEIQKGSDAIFNSTKEGSITKGFNDFFQGVYDAGKATNRKTTVQIGDQNIEINGTIGGLVNSKNFGEAAAILLNDCLPCQPRADGINFKPDLNFLDKLIKPLTELIDIIQSLTLTLLDTGPFKGQFCATLNALNFVCLPDLTAINLALVKNLNLTLGQFPGFKLPGLSDIALFIVMPFLTALTNLVQQWIGVVMKPFKCAIKAIQTQISKLKIKTKGFDLGITANIAKNKNLQLKSHELNKFIGSLDTSDGIQGIVAGLAKMSAYLTNIEKSIMAWIKKNILDKFTNGVNTINKSIEVIASWLKKIAEAANFLLMFAALKNIFYTQFSDCKDKNTAFENSKDIVKNNIGKLLSETPNVQYSNVDGLLNLKKDLFLSTNELNALNLKETFPGLITETISNIQNVDSENTDLLKVSILDRINVDDCINLNLQNTFFDSKELLRQL